MSELATRARELATKMRDECYTSENWIARAKSSCDLAKAITHFEQALLAERRLAKLEAVEIAERWLLPYPEEPIGDKAHNQCVNSIVQALRAAAEKEVGK